MNRVLQLRDAKATFSAVVNNAVRGEPTIITRHGHREAVVIGYEEWERLSRIPSFGELLMACPLADDDLGERDSSGLRDPGF